MHLRFTSEYPFSLYDADVNREQHLGGIHSGCGLSGLVWLLYKVIVDFTDADIQHDVVLIMGTITLVLVGLCALAAFPWIRNNHHKYVDCHVRGTTTDLPSQCVRAPSQIHRLAWLVQHL